MNIESSVKLERSNDGSYYSPDDPGEPNGGKRISVTEDEGAILADLVNGLCALEIGTGLGISTRYMAKTAKLVYTVDIDPWVQKNVWPGLFSLKNAIFLSEPANIVADVAFIDGMHTEEQVLKDIDTAIACGCHLVVGHDLNADAVKRAFNRRFESVFIYNTRYNIGVGHLRDYHG